MKQIIKKPIPKDLFFKFLEPISIKENNYYILSYTSFNKAKFFSTLSNFCFLSEDYYYPSKYYYIKRKLDYNKFLTIIRHICNSSNIHYETKILYNKSKYDVLYYIFY
jgi:hypothetical protein